jgi:DNA-binding MarR family transcriptional regulator
MTDAGRALYAEVMPQAQRSQADMILALTREERRVLFAVLKKLQLKCLQTNADASE